MKKVAVLIENLFDERELVYPYYRLLEEGYEVDLIGTDKNTPYVGKSTFSMSSTHGSKDVSADNYDAVLIPGGFSPDNMRRCQATIDFVREMDKKNKPIAAICHGPWLMTSACNVKDKNMTSFFSIKDDLIHAGANYIDEEVVVDGNLITSRTPKDLPVLLKTFIKEINNK